MRLACCARGHSALRISCLQALSGQMKHAAVYRRFLSTIEESGQKIKGWSAHGSKATMPRPRAEEGWARSLPTAEMRDDSTRLKGSTVDTAEVDKFGAIGAVHLPYFCGATEGWDVPSFVKLEQGC